MKLLVAGGGTGGHLFPGLSAAKRLVEKFPGSQALFIGSRKSLDRELASRYGFSFQSVAQAPLPRRRFSPAMISFFWTFAVSFFKALKAVRRFRPDVALGLGGFSSVPPVLAAALCRVPVVLFEPNLVPGKANLFLSRFASAVAAGFETHAPLFPKNRVVVTGIPVREEIVSAAKARQREAASPRADKKDWTLLVMGGSAGAQALNTVVANAYPKMKERIPGLKLIHLTGRQDYEAVEKHYRYGLGNGSVEVHPFLMEMEKAFARADAVVARGGASSLAEFAVCGLPSVLVPYPFSADDHQVKNAEFFEARAAAKMILQRELSPEKLASTLEEWARDAEKFEGMRAAARKLGRAEATERLVDLLAEARRG